MLQNKVIERQSKSITNVKYNILDRAIIHHYNKTILGMIQ